MKKAVRHSDSDDHVMSDAPTDDEMTFVDKRLEEFNREMTGRDDFLPLNLVFRNSSGQVIAGLKGGTGWDWLYIQVLWVHEAHRRSGLGTRLLRRAEARAAERGCCGSCLSSYSFQAPEFYEKHGYCQCGKIDSYPPGETMLFFEKRLS